LSADVWYASKPPARKGPQGRPNDTTETHPQKLIRPDPHPKAASFKIKARWLSNLEVEITLESHFDIAKIEEAASESDAYLSAYVFKADSSARCRLMQITIDTASATLKWVEVYDVAHTPNINAHITCDNLSPELARESRLAKCGECRCL
jgi:hypothetical protein